MATRPGTVLLLDTPSPQTVEVSFEKMCETMMVTVCQPTPGYGYNHYGHNYCKEITYGYVEAGAFDSNSCLRTVTS
jgi:hypothetical protein